MRYSRLIDIPKHQIKRFLFATSYYNAKYPQIFKWTFSSKESSNFTYKITSTNIQYLAQTIATVTSVSPTLIQEYFSEVLDNQELKQHITQATLEHEGRDISGEKNDFGRRLGWYAFTRITKPHIVIETGVDKGLGALLLNYALIKNHQEDPNYEGAYYGTDINPEAGFLLSAPYDKYGQIMYGDSLQSLSQIEGPIDLFINDSDHSAEYEGQEYELVKGRLSDRAIILGDNAHVTDKLSEFSIKNHRNFLFFKEEPENHWYPGAGIGISFPTSD